MARTPGKGEAPPAAVHDASVAPASAEPRPSETDSKSTPPPRLADQRLAAAAAVASLHGNCAARDAARAEILAPSMGNAPKPSAALRERACTETPKERAATTRAEDGTRLTPAAGGEKDAVEVPVIVEDPVVVDVAVADDVALFVTGTADCVGKAL